MDLEKQLRAALATEDPGPDFTARVMRNVQRRPSTWRVLLPLAAVLAMVAFGLRWHVQQQREEQARQQLALALEITSFELNELQRRLGRDPTQENGT